MIATAKAGMKKRVTLKMVAEHANLSVAAVSQILNGKAVDFSSEANKLRVREIARQLGYRPNLGVKIMRGEQMKSVAVVLSMVQMETDIHIQNIVIQLFKSYEEAGYACYFCSGERDARQNLARIRNLLDYGVERFIFIGTPVGNDELKREIDAAGREAVYYETRTPLPGLFTVHSDTAGAVADIIGEFRRRGLEQIAFFQLTPDGDEQRFAGLAAAYPEYDEAGLHRRFVREMHFDVRHSRDFGRESFRCGMEAVRKLLAEAPDTEAVFLFSDAFALGAVPVLFEHYLATGRMIALAGFNYTYAVETSLYPVVSAEHDCPAIVDALMRDFDAGRPVLSLKPALRYSLAPDYLEHAVMNMKSDPDNHNQPSRRKGK